MLELTVFFASSAALDCDAFAHEFQKVITNAVSNKNSIIKTLCMYL